jgi:hypothetical protein
VPNNFLVFGVKLNFFILRINPCNGLIVFRRVVEGIILEGNIIFLLKQYKDININNNIFIYLTNDI